MGGEGAVSRYAVFHSVNNFIPRLSTLCPLSVRTSSFFLHGGFPGVSMRACRRFRRLDLSFDDRNERSFCFERITYRVAQGSLEIFARFKEGEFEGFVNYEQLLSARKKVDYRMQAIEKQRIKEINK